MTTEQSRNNFPRRKGKYLPDPRCPLSYRIEILQCGALGKCGAKTIDQCPWRNPLKGCGSITIKDPPFWRNDI